MTLRKVDRESVYQGSPNLSSEKKIPITRVDKIVQNPKPVQDEVILDAEPYLPSELLVENVRLAIALGRPLLLQGEPGCGKTRLAYSISFELGLPLEDCYIKSTTKAQDLLYSYDGINRLYDAQLNNPKSQDIRNYIVLGPLGRAIARAHFGQRSVVLIDEIDKADLDFPNDLLFELDRAAFSIPEADEMKYQVPEDHPELRPIVIITHNEEKALPAAFLRRCIYHWVDMPGDDNILKILAINNYVDEIFNREAIEIFKKLRNLGLNKKPGLSEFLDWIAYLQASQIDKNELKKVPFLGSLIKHIGDQERVRKEFDTA